MDYNIRKKVLIFKELYMIFENTKNTTEIEWEKFMTEVYGKLYPSKQHLYLYSHLDDILNSKEDFTTTDMKNFNIMYKTMKHFLNEKNGR